MKTTYTLASEYEGDTLGICPKEILLTFENVEDFETLPTTLSQMLTLLHAIGFNYVNTLVAIKSNGQETSNEDII